MDPTAACARCGNKGTFTEPASFNLMFKTFIGPKEDSTNVVYLRPETAQAMFVDFPQVLASTRKRLPFGIAQCGPAFRNEITPGNFIFRTREFELMEFEYFIHPNEWEKQFEYWLGQMHEWILECGIETNWIHDVEIPDGDRAHYSQRTIDIEFEYPFGRKELYGLVYRTDYDLARHAEYSGKEISYTDPLTNEKYIPHVIEPAFGVSRTFLAVMLSAYHEETAPTGDGETDTRVVLRFPKHLAPVKIAVLPLSKKEALSDVAHPLAERLAKRWRVDYDETQSIGKRYRRQDEIGTPYCVTVDFDTLSDQAVTIRDRDTMEQVRVKIDDLEAWFVQNLTV
jgi:glycyl-tRNA synthetase